MLFYKNILLGCQITKDTIKTKEMTLKLLIGLVILCKTNLNEALGGIVWQD